MGRGARTAVAAAIGVAACRQLVGIGDEPPGAGTSGAADASVDAPAQCGGFAWTGGTCDACMQSACCAEQTACRGDAICAANYDCLAKCPGGDDVCRSACISLPDAVMAPVASCQARSCATECGLRCGGVTGLQPGLTDLPDSACVSCIYSGTNCAAALAYTRSVACMTQQFCLEDCNRLDEFCWDDCFASAAGRACNLGDGGLGPALSACSQICGTGPDWSCLGHVTWPPTTVPTVTYDLHVVDYQTGVSVPDVRGAVCGVSDPDCTKPRGAFMADASGQVPVTTPSGFTGYTQLEAAPDAGYVAELLFHYPPAVQSLDPAWDYSVVMLPAGLLNMLSLAVGPPFDTSRGVIYAEPYDCADNPAPGVSFTISPADSKATPFYEVDGNPTGQPTATATSAGPAVGGGFVNVAPGLVTFVAHAGGQTVATVSIDVRRNGFTYLKHLVPTP